MPNPVGINSYVIDFFSPSNLDYGVVHSINNIGGYQEFATIAERNTIPLINNDPTVLYGGFTASDDKWSSGRRRVGMLAYVMENQKLYTLQPVGYFGNGGSLGETEWDAAPEWERAVRMNPTGTYTKETPAPGNSFTTVYEDAASLGIDVNAENVALTPLELANSCWVELVMGIDGNPITNVQYGVPSAGDLTITLTHDGSGSGTPTIANGGVFTVNIPTSSNTYTSNLAGTIAMVEDVGGMEAGTLVSDIDGQTYDQLFDTILFPTSYPTASQPYVSLTDTFSLKEIGESVDVVLTTTANRGQITLDSSVQGPFAGAVDSATINGPGGPYTLNFGPNPTDIDNLTVSSHTVVEGTAGNQWTLAGGFADGPMPLDSTGADYPNIQWSAAGKTNSTNFEGVYPIFLGNVGGGFDQAPLVSHSFGVSVTSNVIQCDQLYAENSSSPLYHRISIPNDMIDGRNIQVWQLNPVSGSYDEATSGWVQTADANRTIQGNSVQYTLLESSSQVTLGNNYRIKFI